MENILYSMAQYAYTSVGYISKAIARNPGKMALGGLAFLLTVACHEMEEKRPKVPQGSLGSGTGPSSYMSTHKDRGEPKAPSVGGKSCGVNCPTNTHP